MLTDRQLNTTIAALRLWQSMLETGEQIPVDFLIIANNCDSVEILTVDEIDDLIERLYST